MKYPQLSSGALAQYQVRRYRRTGVSRLETASGLVAGAPSEAQWLEWRFAYRGLTGAEARALGDLFEACRGRLESFHFLDPMANLLRGSEDLAGADWERDSGVVLTAGAVDAEVRGRVYALSNGGGAVAGIRQSLPVDRGYAYALSCFARAAAGAAVTLSAGGAGPAVAMAEVVGAAWRRLWLPVRLEEAGLGLVCEVRVGSGVSVELCGVQLEAQPTPGGYKHSATGGALFNSARFGMDELAVVAEEQDSFRADVTVYSEV